MEKENKNTNRFAYENDLGLTVVKEDTSKKEVGETKSDKPKKEEVKKSLFPSVLNYIKSILSQKKDENKDETDEVNITPDFIIKSVKNGDISVKKGKELLLMLEKDIEKGKKANIGEIRVWSGKKMKKTAPDKWEEVVGGKEKKDEEIEVNLFKMGEGGTKGIFESKDGKLYKSIIRTESHFDDEKREFTRKETDLKTDEHKLLKDLQNKSFIPKVGDVVKTSKGDAFEIEKLEEIKSLSYKDFRTIEGHLKELNDSGYFINDKVTVMKRPDTNEFVVIDFSSAIKDKSLIGDSGYKDSLGDDYKNLLSQPEKDRLSIENKSEQIKRKSKYLKSNIKDNQYYLTQRPPSIGTHPTEELEDIEKVSIGGKFANRDVYKLTYKNPLPDKDINSFELLPVIKNDKLGTILTEEFAGDSIDYIISDIKDGVSIKLITIQDGEEIEEIINSKELNKRIKNKTYKEKSSNEITKSFENEESEQEDKITKSLDIVISAYNFGNIDDSTFEKAIKGRDLGSYVKKEQWVTRGGKRFKQNFYYKIGDDKKEQLVDTPTGEELSPEVKGLKIEKYSDKSILIKGDTYANIDLMKKIKEETGWGTFNKALKGWIFGLNQLDKVLGLIWSDVKDKNEDKAEAIKNQKNAALSTGDAVSVNGEKGKVEDAVSDETGIKYNITLEDGTKLTEVDEKVVETNPLTDDKKITETINNASPENRAKTEKILYGIKPIEDIHKYSLSEYMGMHGLTDADIQQALSKIKGETKESTPRGATSSKPKTEKTQQDGLTKQQLISKLIYKHYQSVKNAIEKGEELPEKALLEYQDLKDLYNQKRKAMSEETKRKISEALKKNKIEQEAEKTAKELIDGLSEKDISKIKDSFKTIRNEFVEKQEAILATMIIDRERKEKEKYELFQKSKESDDWVEKNKYEYKARNLSHEVSEDDVKIRNQKNKIKAASNSGDLISMKDKVGVGHNEIPDFTKIDTSEIDYDIDSILTKEKPSYIPDIDEEKFRKGGYMFDMVRVGKDKYLLSTNRYSEFSEKRDGLKSIQGDYDPEMNGYVALTLDQVVLTQDYYTTKQKAKYKEEADKRNKRQVDYWMSFDEKKKEYYYSQRNFYHGLPVKVKKKIDKDSWDALSVTEKEKLYIPVKKYNPERIKSRFDETTMATSFHTMYERFVNPNALRTKKGGETLKRGERRAGTSYASPEVWDSWKYFRETLDWKINDINIQREEMSDMRGKALETSYGESGVNTSLVDELGIKVKRQNGDDIKPQEIEQIKGAWGDIQKTFGELKENAEKDNLKISHAGKTYMFASKAIGVYVPSMKTIGVTAKLGENQLGFTMGHEVAHWVDNTVGKNKGKRYASDDYESYAGEIATTFRQNMNKKSESKYLNATHECFARALEMHHAIQLQGKDAIRAERDKYITSDAYVSMDVYENQIKPLVEKFFDENKEMLKSLNGML